MRRMWHALLYKDLRLMLAGRFFVLALCSLLLYSAYVHFFYAGSDQQMYPVFVYDPHGAFPLADAALQRVSSAQELRAQLEDGYAVGIDVSGGAPHVYLIESGDARIDRIRSAYALSLLSPAPPAEMRTLGAGGRELKNRREISCEILFFELTAVGFLGVASMLFKEKQMGVIRVHGVMPVGKGAFLLSKTSLILLSDLAFAAIFTCVNLGLPAAVFVLPQVLLQTGLLSVSMALIGLLCALLIPGFKQFSLFYLVLAVFLCTPVFIAGQLGVEWSWMRFNPLYHVFMALKGAFFGSTAGGAYCLCYLAVLAALFGLSHRALAREMSRAG